MRRVDAGGGVTIRYHFQKRLNVIGAGGLSSKLLPLARCLVVPHSDTLPASKLPAVFLARRYYTITKSSHGC
jgi:hypothetical protein